MSMVGIITMKETIKEKATGCSSRIYPVKEYLFSRNIVCRQRLGGLLKYYQRAA
jgi:hypothetical protein